MRNSLVHRVYVVVPVYQGARTLPELMAEVAGLTSEQQTRNGHCFIVCEVSLVHDCGLDRCDETMEALGDNYHFVQPVWLSRNYGQHAATVASMASATGDRVITMDEDGQQDPKNIGALLDCALSKCFQRVYAWPTNPALHGWLRNFLSRTAKALSTKLLGN